MHWRINNISLDGEKNRKLIETFVFNQLSAIIDAQDAHYSLYHYRDREKREIDFIIENESSDILAIEVKAGSAIDKKHFKHIAWFQENMARNKKFIGIVLYTGNHVASFGDNMWAIPISAMWF